MFTSIDSKALSTINGGTGPKYLADQSELDRRSKLSPTDRAAADVAWTKTFASLSKEKQDAIRARASQNAARAAVPTVPTVPTAPSAGVYDGI